MISAAALSLAVATGLGAYASHGLSGVLDADTLGSLLTAIQYQFYHSLGLLFLGLVNARAPSRLWVVAAVLFAAGLVLFCGGLSARALGGPEWLAGGAPFGGTCFIAGWLLLAIAAMRSRTAMLG
jgi:uncharacterized membrane protein YgdD (TMEM256/DUF423 family)